MNTDEISVVETDNSPEELTIIDGIGKAYAEILFDNGVHHYSDLAQYETPTDLHQFLIEAGVTKIKLDKIENKNSKKGMGDWLQQARKLVEIDINEDLPKDLPLEVEEVDESLSETIWRQHAGFSVFFDYAMDKNGEQSWQTRVWQTRTYHDESGHEKPFPGVDPLPWVNWILEQAEIPNADRFLPTQIKHVEQSIPPEPKISATRKEIELVILDVQVTEAGLSSNARGQNLILQIDYQIYGHSAEMNTSNYLDFRVEVHAVNLENGDSILVVSEKGQIQPQFAYTHQQKFPIPRVGKYELQSQVVISLNNKEYCDCFEGPKFKVVSKKPS